MSWIWRIPLGLIGLWLAVLGLHGLYIHFNLFTALLNINNTSNLFLVLKLPIKFLSDQVYWMSGSGMQSWVTPGVIFVVGAFLIYGCFFKK